MNIKEDVFELVYFYLLFPVTVATAVWIAWNYGPSEVFNAPKMTWLQTFLSIFLVTNVPRVFVSGLKGPLFKRK